MDLTSIKTIKELLEKHAASPSKIMGQNFLVDRTVLSKIIEAADLHAEDTVLEVGPGLGTLTKELAQKAGKVIAIEKDRAMLEILKETLKDYQNVHVVQGDALRYKVELKKYKVVANIPYYVTSPVIRKFLEEKIQPDQIILMVQKEVAKRICSTPPDMSLLAVSVQFYAKAKIIRAVSKGCFWPSPKVDSAIIKITPFARTVLAKGAEEASSELFFNVAKAGFLHPRKQLANNLAQGLKKEKQEIQSWLLKNNISPAQRAETLTIQDWINLTNSF